MENAEGTSVKTKHSTQGSGNKEIVSELEEETEDDDSSNKQQELEMHTKLNCARCVDGDFKDIMLKKHQDIIQV